MDDEESNNDDGNDTETMEMNDETRGRLRELILFRKH